MCTGGEHDAPLGHPHAFSGRIQDKNIYTANISGQIGPDGLTGLRVNGRRAIRAAGCRTCTGCARNYGIRCGRST